MPAPATITSSGGYYSTAALANYAYEPRRDILDKRENILHYGFGGTNLSTCDYTVNSLGQRTGVTTSGTAFTASAGWAWGYDSLGQVISAEHKCPDLLAEVGAMT